MQDLLYSGTWEGHYFHGEGYPEDRRKVKVGFLAEITVVDGKLTGTCEEYVTKVHLRKPAVLEGFIEDGQIRFTKLYPYFYEVDENQEVIVDFSRIAHPVHYSGQYIPVSGIFSGQWELAVVQGDLYEDVGTIFSGGWEMRKV